MTNRRVLRYTIFGCIGIFAALGLIKFLMIRHAIAEGAKHAPGPDAVTSIIASETKWQRTLTAVGSIAPVQGVTLSAEESGKVVKINFESGAVVNAGDTLVELDSTVEVANLDAAVAKADLAHRALLRAKNLRATNAMSQSDLDAADSEARAADATAASLRAVIARKKVIAPFSGTTGIRMVNVGQYLSPGTPVVPLYAMEKVYVNFSLPQQSLPSLAVGQDVKFEVDAYPGVAFSAKISAINPQVDGATRNVEVQALADNSAKQLRSGMFASTEVILPTADTVIPIPATSILYAPYGDRVYVIDAGKDQNGQDQLTVRQQVVKLGARRGDQIAVLSGIKAGDQIVTSGVFKLRPGGPVVVNNALSPTNEINPKPADT